MDEKRLVRRNDGCDNASEVNDSLERRVRIAPKRLPSNSRLTKRNERKGNRQTPSARATR